MGALGHDTGVNHSYLLGGRRCVKRRSHRPQEIRLCLCLCVCVCVCFCFCPCFRLRKCSGTCMCTYLYMDVCVCVCVCARARACACVMQQRSTPATQQHTQIAGQYMYV